MLHRVRVMRLGVELFLVRDSLGVICRTTVPYVYRKNIINLEYDQKYLLCII